MNHYTCPHTHLLHSNRCHCQYESKDCVAEKEFAACLNKQASQDCIALYQSLKAQSDFAIDSQNQTTLSVGQQNKIKMGGLLALQTLITGKEQQTINNIHALNILIKKTYGGFEQLPFTKLMPSIRAFKFRQSRLKKSSQNQD